MKIWIEMIVSSRLCCSYCSCSISAELQLFDHILFTSINNQWSQCTCLFSLIAHLPNIFRTRRGFHVSLQSTCGGYVSSSRGLLTSPGYPGNCPADTECEWVVRMRPATMISFSFLDLDIGAESDTECSQDYLVIRNGERASSPFFLINPRQGNNQVNKE